MIAYLKGKVIDVFDGGVVLENGGVGYELACSASLLNKLTADKEGEAFTYLQVRDDGFSLFGFSTKEEKRAFLKLIGVSNVGPKVAMSVISGMGVANLATAIALNDVKSLSKVKGVAKKTAERIILELRDSVAKGEIESSVSGGTFVSPVEANSEDDDVTAVLLSLGFQSAECKKAIASARASGAVSVEEVISAALKVMGR